MKYYSEVLDIEEVGIKDIEENHIVDFIISCIDAGKYPIIDLDHTALYNLNYAEPFLHETFFYGYGTEEKCFYLTKFNITYSDKKVPFAAVEKAYSYVRNHYLNNPKASRCVYNLADIIDLVLNNPHDYKGIIINPESDAVKVDIKRLARYKTDSVMCHADKMKKLLKKLNQKEISYIGDLSYDSICKAYYEKTTPKNIAKDLGKTYDEIDEALDNGYTALMKIVFDNYN